MIKCSTLESKVILVLVHW